MAALKFYNEETKAWEQLASPAAGGGSLLQFVDTLPAAAAATSGIIYAVKTSSGAYELWALNGTEMASIAGSGEAVSKELIYGETYLDFPATGEADKLYIATSNNTTYRWDSTVNKYRTVGDKVGSALAGEEQEGDLGEFSAEDVVNAFKS